MSDTPEKSQAKGSDHKKENDRSLEIESIKKVADALGPIDRQAQIRVLNYVIEMVGLKDAFGPSARPLQTAPAAAVAAPLAPGATAVVVQDIRSLKEQKNPTTAVEMTALAAFYLSEAAPATERSDSIGVDDLKRLFKQAGYPLPPKPHMTLVHSKNAGYFDSAGTGRYKLNPVGYNLVAHGLPSGGKRKGKA